MSLYSKRQGWWNHWETQD